MRFSVRVRNRNAVIIVVIFGQPFYFTIRKGNKPELFIIMRFGFPPAENKPAHIGKPVEMPDFFPRLYKNLLRRSAFDINYKRVTLLFFFIIDSSRKKYFLSVRRPDGLCQMRYKFRHSSLVKQAIISSVRIADSYFFVSIVIAQT